MLLVGVVLQSKYNGNINLLTSCLYYAEREVKRFHHRLACDILLRLRAVFKVCFSPCT